LLALSAGRLAIELRAVKVVRVLGHAELLSQSDISFATGRLTTPTR